MLDMVLSAITEALAAHEADAATVEVVREDPVGLWRLEVTPRAAGAAPLSVVGAEAIGDDEVTLMFGETHFYIGGSRERLQDVCGSPVTLSSGDASRRPGYAASREQDLLCRPAKFGQWAMSVGRCGGTAGAAPTRRTLRRSATRNGTPRGTRRTRGPCRDAGV